MCSKILLLLSLIFSSLFSDCDNVSTPPRKIYIFIDQSGSVSDFQRNQWKVSGDTFLSKLKFGDELIIFGLHQNTENAMPLFEGKSSLLEDGAGAEETQDARQSLSKLKTDAKIAILNALDTKINSKSTDIFSAVNRVKKDANKKIFVLFYSDMLNSSSDFNMEKRLEENDFVSQIEKIGNRNHWDNRTLQGMSVYVVLPSFEGTQSQPINNRQSLQIFYEILFKSLGAEFNNFDTHLVNGGEL